jgi:hypothetical protein
MNTGDKCEYKSHIDVDDKWVWNTGTIVKIVGPYSARVYTIIGTGFATGELVTKTRVYLREVK